MKQPEPLAESVRATASGTVMMALDELERMIGLSRAKKVIYEIYALHPAIDGLTEVTEYFFMFIVKLNFLNLSGAEQTLSGNRFRSKIN